MKIFRKNILGTVAVYLSLMLAFGFPLTSGIIILLKSPNQTEINIIIRVIYILTSLYLIIGSFFHKSSNKLSIGGYAILVFWIIYMCRLLYDLFYVGIKFINGDTFFVLSFAIGNGLIPTIALLRTGKYVDLQQLSKVGFIIILISNVFITYFLIKYFGFGLDLFASRAYLSFTDSAGDEKTILNPITISLMGEALGVISFYFILFPSKESPLYKKVFLFPFFIIAMINLLFGGSRGPLLGFLMLVMLITYFYLKVGSYSVIYNLKLLIVAFSIVSLIVIYLPFLKENFTLIARFTDTIDSRTSGGTEKRDYHLISAWNIFVDSPFIGGRFVEDYENHYPHNVYLEALMATGIIGGGFFFIAIGTALRKLRRFYLKYIGSKIFIVFVFILVNMIAVAISGSLFTSVGFWSMLALFLSIDLQEKLIY